MKSELKSYTQLVRNVNSFDWDGLPGAAEWKQKQKETDADEGNDEAQTCWQDHISEKCRRIWEWWIVHRKSFPYLSEAARLVILVQASSAAGERVFSQLRLIIGETTQHNVLLHAALQRLKLILPCI